MVKNEWHGVVHDFPTRVLKRNGYGTRAPCILYLNLEVDLISIYLQREHLFEYGKAISSLSFC